MHERRLTDIVEGVVGFQAVQIAHDLSLFDALAETPLSIESLAERLGIATRGSESLASICASIGLVTLHSDLVELSDFGRACLDPGNPLSVAGLLRELSIEPEVASFDALRSAIVRGRSPIVEQRGLFARMAEDPELAHRFTKMMHAHSAKPAASWPPLAPLDGSSHMLDIGGGSGVHAVHAARTWDSLEATVLELPAVCEFARSTIRDAALDDRVRVRECDFWNDPFPRADAHFYSDIFHDWPPDRCFDLAKKSFESLPGQGRIIVHEMLLDDSKDGPFAVAASSLSMLLWCNGQQFSASELKGILRAAGFTDLRVQATLGYWSIVTGHKP